MSTRWKQFCRSETNSNFLTDVVGLDCHRIQFSRRRAWRIKKKERNNSEACKCRTCAWRKFPENWKIINWQTTLKKLARSARMLPGEIFLFFLFLTLSLVLWAVVNFRPRWYWLICLKSSLAAPPHPLSCYSHFCFAYTLWNEKTIEMIKILEISFEYTNNRHCDQCLSVLFNKYFWKYRCLSLVYYS